MEIPGQVPISNTEVIGVNLIPNIPGLHFIGPQSDNDGILLYCLTMSRKNRKTFWVCQEFWLKICMDHFPSSISYCSSSLGPDGYLAAGRLNTDEGFVPRFNFT